MHGEGTNKVIVPWANWKDVESEVPKEVCAQIQFVFAWMVRKVLDVVFEGHHHDIPHAGCQEICQCRFGWCPQRGHQWPRKQDVQLYLQIKSC